MTTFYVGGQKSIAVKNNTFDRLKGKKVHPRQSFDEVINDLFDNQRKRKSRSK